MTIDAPRVETPTDYILLGIHEDLDRALKLAVKEVVDYLVAEKGLTPANALSLASIAIDFGRGGGRPPGRRREDPEAHLRRRCGRDAVAHFTSTPGS